MPSVRVILLAFSLFYLVHCLKPYSNWKFCRQSEKDLEKCMLEAAAIAVQNLKNGSPELGVASLDPLHIKSMVFNDRGRDKERFAIRINLSDIQAYGISEVKLLSIKHSWKTLMTTINTTLPVQYIVEGHYKVDGKVLLLPITGEGKARFVFDDFKSFIQMKMAREKRNNVDYGKLVDFDFDFTTSKLHMELNNLFNGSRLLGDNLNLVINENWQEVFDEMYPSIKSALRKELRVYPEKFFNTVPFSVLGPP